MRAELLNGTPATLNAGPESGESIGDLIQSTNDPTLWGTEAMQPSTRADGFDVSKAVKWIETGAEIQKAGGVALGGVDFTSLAAQVATGAAMGATVPPGNPVGALVGAIVGAVAWIASNWNALFNPVPSDWQGAGEGVHEWFTEYGPQEFLDWVRETKPELLATNPQQLTRALCLFWLERYGYVVTDAPGQRIYSGIPDSVYFNFAGGFDALNALYIPMGIDYPLTRLERHPVGTVTAALPGVESQGRGGVWMLNRKIYGRPSLTRPPAVASKPESQSVNLLLGALAVGFGAYALTRRTN